ncbi:hypothetical protein TL16_g03382 [Triparma laevis f. inornata]|uniref:EF-hand domain-containing protein n=1 Tax=Triparma laevis f. inornata TaxID=1714386 RepID=A0A9W7A1V6_9STRA|nr:hypothetical protein TL16_g03382 [Triparma laevis f. inornata]
MSSSPSVGYDRVKASVYELSTVVPKVFLRPATTTPLQQSVHEVVVSGDTMYLLMLDGTLQTWSAVFGGPTALATSTRVITHEPTPDPSGGSITTKRSESQSANFEWRQSVNLDNADERDSSTTPENVDAEFLAAKFAKELLSMTPRVDVLHVCPHTSSLLLNTTAGDRCIRFHESVSLRRTHRVRLQLPNMPYFDHGLFDVGPGGYENGNGVNHRVSSHMGDETAGAMQKFVYLPHSSVLIGTVVGSPVLVGFCTVSGLPLARFVGHCLPKFSKNAVAVSSLVSTLNFNGHVASGGSDGDIRVWDVGSELLPAVKRRWAPARDAIMSGSGASRMRFGDIASFEDSLVSRKSSKFSHKVNTLYADPSKLEKFSSLRNSIKNSMGDEEGSGMIVWRFGTVTAIVDASVSNASLELGAPSDNFLLRAERHYVEVTYDDGSTQFNVPKRLIRTVQEASKRGDRGPNFDDDPVVVFLEDSGTIVPLMSAIGEKVAVWTTKTRVYDLVLSMFSHLDSAASFDAPVNAFVSVLSSMLAREYNDEGDENDLNSVNALSSAVANMAIEDLEELASAFDEFETGFVDVKMFATWVSQGVLIPSTGVGWRTRLVTSSRVVQKAHLGGVSTLGYLPHSMLLVSGGFGDNEVKMWDPVAHRHRLVRPDCGPVVRWRGKSSKDAYQSLPEEWTDAGSPYNEVCGVDIVSALKALEGGLTKIVVNEFGDEIEEDLSEGVKVVPVGFKSMVVSDCVADITTVRCDDVNVKAARSIDSENREGKKESFMNDPDSYAGGGAKTGFLYCLGNGDVFIVESKDGFDENFVLMERETLTVKVGVGKVDAFDEVEEAKKVFDNRTKVRRIAYVAMSGSDGGTLRELKSTVVEMGCMSKASPTASLLSLGVRAVVFFSDKDDGSTSLKNDERNDGQARSLSGMRTASAVVVSINNSGGTAVVAPESLYYPGAVGQLTVPLSRIVEGTLEVGGKVKYGVAASVAIGGEEERNGGGAAELLCCEVIVTIGEGVFRKIVCFAVGRTTVRVKASDFDRSEGDRALISNAKVAFLQRFESSLNRFRAISPRSVNGMVKGLRGKDEVVKTALREIQSAVIDEPTLGSAGKGGGKEGAIRDAFQKFIVLGRSDALKVAMFEVTAALSSHGEFLWAAEERGELRVGDIIQALVQHMKVCSRGYHVLAPLLLSTGGGGMGPLCESLVGLVSSGGHGSVVTWDNVKSFVSSACMRIVGSSITVEQTYLIAASSLLLPTPPFRASPEAFARSVGAVHPTLKYVGPEGLENMALGRDSDADAGGVPATLPLCLESESFAEVLGTMNPMTVSKMQLEKLQSIINDGFGYKKAPVDNGGGEVEEFETDASSYMAQYACMLATQKVVDEVREATELVANLGHAVRQRASELLLEGPMLSLSSSGDGFVDGAVGEEGFREEIKKARMHAYSTMNDRCARGIVGYEGWGWRSDGSEAEGCPVTVLEIGPERLEEVQSSDKQPFSAHLVRILNHAQMDKSISGRSDMVQYYGGVDVDVQGREEGSGGGGLKSRARAAHVVSTSLEDFTPLSDVVSAKGGIGGNTSGVRLARYIGREVLRTLSRINGSNFLLRDLNLKSIYLPPPASNKSNVVLGSYLHMGVLDETGKLGSEAPDLDSALFSLTSVLCPPEALVVKGDEGGRRVEFCDTRSGGGGKDEVGRPATKSWDTWCFGTMLFELVTGKKIPSYGSSLVSYLSNVEKIGGGEDSGKLLKRFNYDWIRSIGESKKAGRAGLILASSVLDAATNGEGEEGEEIDVEGSSLLASAALLASIGGGFSYRALLPRSAQLAKRGGGKNAVLEAIRQKWIRLEMKAEGHEVGCCSWPELWSPSERHHAAELMFGDELICGGILPHIVACTLRFVSSDQGNITGYYFKNASAIGGSASATLAQRLMTRIARFFESILLETRPIVEGGSSVKDGPVSGFVGRVLESLVKLYLGEEGGLASIYGRGEGLNIDFSGLGGSNLVYGDGLDFDENRSWGPFGRDSNSVCHWSSTFMSMIEPVLLLAITESGSGNHLYAPICDWIVSSKGKIESGGEELGGQGGEDLVDDDLEEGGVEIKGGKKKSLPFLRTSNYYGELVSLGRTLANLSAASRGQGRTGARARRSCVSYVLTMVRLWGLREGGNGGVEGLSARPDALSSMQRAQLLLDVRIAGKLLPYIADYDGEALAKVLNSGGGGKDDEACRVLAGQCLERMAGAGDIACEAWGAAGVIGSLGIALADNRRAGSKEGALSVFESLAGSSAPNLSKLLQVYPSISGSLSSIGVSLPPPLTLPMLSQRGLDLTKGHTMAEVQQLVVMVRSLVGTAAQMDDNLVLGECRPPESLIKLVGQIWGWFEVYWLKAVVAHGVGGKDSMEGARANWGRDEDRGGGGGGGLDEEAESKRRGMDLTKKLLVDVGLGLEDAGLEEDGEVGDGKRVSGSGLTAMVTKIGKNRGGGNVGFEPYRADRLVDLKTKIMHAVASGMKMGGAMVCDKLLNAGVALYFGEAMHAGCMLVKNSVETGSEHIHLATSYAAACAARFRMWESLLVSRSGKCAEQILLSGVCELIVGVMLRDEKTVDVTNVVIDLGFAPFNGKRLCRNEAIDMMVCCKRGAGGDGVTVVSKAVVSEIIRQARKYDTVAQERESLWRMGGGGKGLKAKQARSEVIRVMRSLLALRSGEIVRDLQFVGGVRTELLEREVALWTGGGLSMSQKKSLAAEWVKWAKGQAEQYDDVRYIADEDEDALFRYDEDLKELLGSGGKERMVTCGEERVELGDGAKEAFSRGVMESMAVTVGGGVEAAGVEKPEAVARGVSAQAVVTQTPVVQAQTQAQQREVAPVQKLLNSIAADVGCDDNQISALSVRRGVQKGGRGEASVVELSVNEGVATAIHARARAGEFLRDAGDGLRFVSVEVQSLGRIDGSGNEVFGAIDDDMDFGASGAGGGRGNNMSMSGGVSNFVDEPPMKTYVDNLRVSRGSGGWVGGGSGVEAGTQYPARSGGRGGGMASARKAVDEEEAASLPVLLDRLGSAMAEIRMVFDGRSGGGGGEDGEMQRGDILNGLLDLRIDPVLARDILRKNSGLDRYSFADFVVIHAKASGYDGGGDEGGNGKVNLPGELWCENGNGGLWLCLGGRDVGKLRRGFEMFAKRGGVDGDMVVDGRSKIGDALRGVGGLEVGEVQLDKYLSGRGGVLGGERLGFQEFCRCWGDLKSEARKTPGFSSGGGAHWASKMQEKSKAKFKGGERNLVGMGGRGGEEGGGGLRGELKNRAVKKGFVELSGGRDTITIGSLRVAMAKKGGRVGEDEDLEMKRFIKSRGGSLRVGLSLSQFQKAYEEGRGSVTGGSLSLPFVDGGGSSGERFAAASDKKGKEKGRDGKSRRKQVVSDIESEEEEDSDDESRRGKRRGGRKDKREGIDDEVEDMVVDEFTEDAIMKTFMMYDLNGDGVISYLELKTTFQQQGRDSSDYEIRAWIRSRDSSGTGSVNLVDFRRAYLAKLRKRTKA